MLFFFLPPSFLLRRFMESQSSGGGGRSCCGESPLAAAVRESPCCRCRSFTHVSPVCVLKKREKKHSTSALASSRSLCRCADLRRHRQRRRRPNLPPTHSMSRLDDSYLALLIGLPLYGSLKPAVSSLKGHMKASCRRARPALTSAGAGEPVGWSPAHPPSHRRELGPHQQTTAAAAARHPDTAGASAKKLEPARSSQYMYISVYASICTVCVCWDIDQILMNETKKMCFHRRLSALIWGVNYNSF